MNMKTWFGNQPIQSKLILINIIVILTALIPIFGIMLSYEYYAVKHATLREMQVQADIVSDSVATAMAFADAKVASEALASLRASPDVMQAALMLPNGRVLATYHKKGEVFSADKDTFKMSVGNSTWGRFRIYTKISLHAVPVGNLMLESSLASFYSRMSIYFAVILLISGLGLALAIWLASVLQRSITGPLSHLTALTHRVTADEEYSVYPVVESDDEIGGLSRAFGHMVFHVQERINSILSESERQFRTMAENTPDMIIRYGVHCHRVFVNEAYTKNTGFSPEQLLNRPLGEAWTAKNLSSDEYKARLQMVMETGVPDRILLEWTDRNAKVVSYDMYVVSEQDAKGQVIGTLAFGRNISMLKDIERNLDESQSLILEWASIRERTLEEERKRIAREIHDELGQLLTLLRLQIQLLPCKLDNLEQLPERIAETVKIVDSSIHVVRNIASSLRTAVLDSGIVPALRWLTDEFSRQTGIVCKLHADQKDAPTNEHTITELFRIVQESLTNVTRHSEGTEVTIKLEKLSTPPQFILEIQDNGKGFKPDAKNTKKSFGLVGMHERVRMLSGELTISSTIEHGTLLSICIPNNEVTEKL